jgi:predicted RNA-binding protein YlqC (UPF0109 family)
MNSPFDVASTDNGSGSIKDMVEIIARALVDQPEAVSVTEISGANTNIVELKVAKVDMGKIIGKQGRTANAMRAIVNAVSAKTRRRSVLEIVE